MQTLYDSKPASRNPAAAVVSAFGEIWAHREMCWILFCRDLKASFRGSILGYVWLFLPPAATTAVWIILNKSRVVDFGDPTVPYPLFVLVGTTLWSGFTRAATLPLQSFQLSKPIFSKIRIPLGAFMAVAPLRAMFDLLLYGAVSAVVFCSYGIELVPTMLLLPFAAVASVLLGFAVALLLLPVSALYSDVQQGITLVFAVAIYLAPVVYPAPEEGTFAKWIQWNPITPIIESSREWIFDGSATGLPEVLLVIFGALSTIGVMLAAMRIAMPHLVARMGM